MQGSKIRLSPSEAALICNADIILTKNSIIQKTVALLAQVQEEIGATGKQLHLASTPKISKGENYRGLPYVVLDYPRIAQGEDLFFIRSMFWWGHFFSSTLQLAGAPKQQHLQRLAGAFPLLASKDYYVGINDDPWQHHFEPTNVQKISALTEDGFLRVLQQQAHIKIAAFWSLSQWDSAATILAANWKFLVDLIA